ncbi:uncharacterized protein LOC132561434 [Ylistrum balloti]|uniref:uncharacterized protein LOC132561434 n=1 Tax=Ylistrum balloti TaxID=509963 RepID=UPI002905C5AA|nr:uncharacterized protein LOC132561434 [Ylistrum balloti]
MECDKGKKKFIEKIDLPDSSCVTNSSDILAAFRDFYIKLFSEEDIDFELADSFCDNLPKLNELEMSMCEGPIGKEEILAAIKHMKNNKSPGSDGLTKEFYLTFFDLLGDHLVTLYNDIFQKETCCDLYQLIPIIVISYLPGTGATDSMDAANASMTHIDLEVLQRSVRMVVSGSRKHSVTRFEVVKSLLSSGFAGENIVSVFRCEAPNTWFVTVTSREVVDNIVENGQMKETYFTLSPERCDQRRLSIRVQWLPTWIEDEAIAEDFNELYGKVIRIGRETTTIGGVTLETGTREIILMIREGDQDRIPYRARLFGKVALIMVPGRPPICLRCQQIGHVRSQCPGRPEPTTRATYANKAQATSQSAVEIPPTGTVAQQEESEPAISKDETASPSSGGSSMDTFSAKRPGPVIDEDGFQRVTKKGKHSASSPAFLSNGDLVPGQRCSEDRSDSDMSEDDHLVIDEGTL